ncbi:MAG: hypothetical protein GY869_11620 [Planctomycetes bacterium]|nr:hypothetical protein [Planctomycetota bacterium]
MTRYTWGDKMGIQQGEQLRWILRIFSRKKALERHKAKGISFVVSLRDFDIIYFDTDFHWLTLINRPRREAPDVPRRIPT